MCGSRQYNYSMSSNSQVLLVREMIPSLDHFDGVKLSYCRLHFMYIFTKFQTNTIIIRSTTTKVRQPRFRKMVIYNQVKPIKACQYFI